MKQIQSYEAHKQEGILLNANELSVNLNQDIVKEIQERIPAILFNRYPEEPVTKLYEAYAEVIGCQASQVLAGNGSDQMLGYLIGTFLGQGKKAYTIAPDFGMYDYYCSSYDAGIEKYATEEDGSFDIEDFIKVGKEKGVNLVLFSNPNNPTGHALSKAEVLKIVTGFDCPVIVDEAYMEFYGESVFDEVENYENLYVTRTLSKAYGLAGIRCGFLISSQERIAKLKANFIPYALSRLTQEVAIIALSHAKEFDESTSFTCAQRDEMYEIIKDFKKMTFYPSKANFICGKCANKEALLAAFEKENIVIRNYAGKDTFRITIGSKEENKKVLEILTAFEGE
ncbi:MAG: histidinol-phosphate transaminase [Firmicutes bacterium]|nr:histidinol-phosphate transaminase [Bacillota bacterium]